jgi:hypothetical protein
MSKAPTKADLERENARLRVELTASQQREEIWRVRCARAEGIAYAPDRVAENPRPVAR